MHFVPVVDWWSQMRTAINLTLLVLCSQVANRRKTYARNCCGKDPVTIHMISVMSAGISTDMNGNVAVLAVLATKIIRFAC